MYIIEVVIFTRWVCMLNKDYFKTVPSLMLSLIPSVLLLNFLIVVQNCYYLFIFRYVSKSLSVNEFEYFLAVIISWYSVKIYSLGISLWLVLPRFFVKFLLVNTGHVLFFLTSLHLWLIDFTMIDEWWCCIIVLKYGGYSSSSVLASVYL